MPKPFVLLLCEGASSRARVNKFLPSEVSTTFTQHSRKLQKHPGSDTELRGAPAISLIDSQLLKILQIEKKPILYKEGAGLCTTTVLVTHTLLRNQNLLFMTSALLLNL